MNFDIVYNCETVTEIKIMNISTPPKFPYTFIIPPCCFPILPYPPALSSLPSLKSLICFLLLQNHTIYTLFFVLLLLPINGYMMRVTVQKLYYLGVNCMSGTKGRNESRITWKILIQTVGRIISLSPRLWKLGTVLVCLIVNLWEVGDVQGYLLFIYMGF